MKDEIFVFVAGGCAGFLLAMIFLMATTENRIYVESEYLRLENETFRMQKEAITLGYGYTLKNGEFVWKKAEAGR